MLSDDRLQHLLRAAHDLKSLEPVAPASRPPVTRRRARWVIPAAAVIGLYAATQLTLDVVMPKLAARRSAAQHAAKAGHAPGASPATASLLLAVYQNDAGHLSCVNWSADALKGRAVATLPAEELTRLALALSCDPQAARILVVGLEGPASSLPSSDDRAKAVAQCLSTTVPCSTGEFNARTCASAGCLDGSIKVRIESLALK